MPPEAKVLVAAVGLGLVHIVAAAQGANLQRGYRWGAGPRDTPAPPLIGIPGRLHRAAQNFAETFPFFAVAVLLAGQQGVSNAVTLYSAITYLVARLIYLGLYVAGTFLWRSLAWNVAALAILTLLWGVFAG